MIKKAIFAAGCFWGVEDTFMHIEGVESTFVGYTGGDIENPTYEKVCNEDTGHAESVEVFFDDEKITYDNLLDTFWSIHNPTTKDRQGPDVGSQYRSAIFYIDDAQKKQALASKQKHQKFYEQPIVTEIVPLREFFKAEEYHQQYFQKTGKKNCKLKF